MEYCKYFENTVYSNENDALYSCDNNLIEEQFPHYFNKTSFKNKIQDLLY
jgi:hypothetical protein